MSNLAQLSPGELIYYRPDVQPASQQTNVVTLQSKADQPDKQVLRRAGRKKLTPEKQAERDRYLAILQVSNQQARARAREKRKTEKDRLLLAKKEKQLLAAGQLKEREMLIAEMNRRDMVSIPRRLPDPIIIGGSAITSSVVKQVAGAPPLAGFTSVRINRTIVIHVKNGADIDQFNCHFQAKTQTAITALRSFFNAVYL